MLSQLVQAGTSFFHLLFRFFGHGLRSSVRRIATRILSEYRLPTTAKSLFSAFASFMIAFIENRACVILLTHRDLWAIGSILTIENIGAIHVDRGGINIFNHIIPQFLVVRSHSHTMSQILSVIQFFFMITVNFLLNLVYLCLNIAKTPLLTFLHLDHHFLNLIELLKAISLHFF